MKKKGHLYDKYYKFILIVPAILFIFAIIYLAQFSAEHGDLIRKDVSLTGGTTITILDETIDIVALRTGLSSEFPDIKVRSISDIRTGSQQAVVIETASEVSQIQPALENYLGYELNPENSSIEFSGATLSQGFYHQLIGSIIAAFLLMAWVVFFIFGTSNKMKAITMTLTGLGLGLVLTGIGLIEVAAFALVIGGFIFGILKSEKGKYNYLIFAGVAIVSFILLQFSFYPETIVLVLVSLALLTIYTLYSIPSMAVIIAAFADITMTIAVVNLVGMELSAAGIVGILMLIGYSVDTDILLTSKVVRRKEGTVNEKIVSAFKTGITMTLTSIIAIAVALVIIYNFSETLRQIFTILLIGLAFDIFNTWTTNASLIKWYAEKKK